MTIQQKINPLSNGDARCWAPGMTGFTLLEILIALMIMGILLMITTSTALNWVLDRRLSYACQMMVSGIEYTAVLSTRYQRPFKFETSTVDNTFEIVDTKPYPDTTLTQRLANIPPVNSDGVVLHPLTKQWYLIDFDLIHDLDSIQIISEPAAVLTFDANGIAPYGYSTYEVGAGGQIRTIIVNGVTGNVSVQ